MNESFVQYYRCPESYVRFELKGALSDNKGYFRFGQDTVCYGRYGDRQVSPRPVGLFDAEWDLFPSRESVHLRFDPSEVADNLRREVYSELSSKNRHLSLGSAIAEAYYLIRPLMPVRFRKYLQKARLSGWESLLFPHWPVDRSVDRLMEHLLLLVLRSQKLERMPFVWFWPNGAPSACIMTHDVETTAGRDFSSTLMDIDDAFGIKSEFEVVPEKRYDVPRSYLDSITTRGFGLGVQDLNHDGRLYKNKQQFLERAAKINNYGREWGVKGFRAGVLYRRQEWFDALKFEYDMSVPNVAHLDPQRGGCCTVMPYFVGNILEIPVTATQDYSLFHILNDHSMDLWKRQIELIMEQHGLISFIVHPDYIITEREQKMYESLLAYLAELRDHRAVWIGTPSEVNDWWRQRDQMILVDVGGEWRVEGVGSERASVAYAREQDGRLIFEVGGNAQLQASESTPPCGRGKATNFAG